MSAISRVRGIVAARSLRGRIRVDGQASFGRGVGLGRGVRIDVARGATLRVGEGCRLGAGCRLTVCGGAVELGAGSVLGEKCTLIGRREIRVGEGSRLDEGVSILDFGPAPIDTERPTRVQPLYEAAVVLGRGSVVGLRAALGPGVRLPPSGRVEPGAVLGGLAEPLLAALDPPPSLRAKPAPPKPAPPKPAPPKPAPPKPAPPKPQAGALSSEQALAKPGRPEEVGE